MSTIWQRRPILAATVIEGMLIPLALLLAFVLGIRPWEAFEISGTALAKGVIATLPMLLFFGAVARMRFAWVREIEDKIRTVLLPMFRNSGRMAIIWVALLAGIAEELLFRGVIQAGLESWLGEATGLLLASLVFGLVHYITRAYFILATLMGLYLGLLYQWTGNLLVPVLVHALYDWIALEWYLHRERRREAG